MSVAGRPERFDAVVIGSGFGGSVSAYRLAEAGKRVLLLERGKEYPPGSFARTPNEMRTNFWDPTRGLHGLFDLWSFQGLNALVSSGLGGGSLIYANVLLRKDERWFVQEDLDRGGFEYWPVNRDDLDPHYDRVEAMMRPQRYPLDHEPYASTPKTNEFRAAAQRKGYDWFLPNLGVTFGNPGETPVTGEPIKEEHPNLHGRTRLTCRLVGECDLGCNYGAKNSLDYTYLSEAQRVGAEIRSRSEVRALEPLDGGGYRVRYIHYAPEHEGEELDIFDPQHSSNVVDCDRLIIAGGTLGSVRLILRNRAAFPKLSKMMGTRFCGNGDLLTFAYRSSREEDGKRVPRTIDPSYGPVITSTIRVPDELDGGDGRGFYVQDAGFPSFATWLLQLAEMPSDLWHWRSEALRFGRERMMRRGYRHTGRSAAFAALMGSAQVSSTLLPLLAMGRDVPDGRMYLHGNHLRVDWKKGIASGGRPGKGQSGEFFARARGACKEIATELGGSFRDNPIWFMRRVITVHPLGGCPMGRHEGEGVVNEWGEVFGYPGLYIADGSVMPGPVGANPSLTIAALADRFADGIIESPNGGGA